MKGSAADTLRGLGGPVAVFGAEGQMGSAWCRELEKLGVPFVAQTEKDGDLARADEIGRRLDRLAPKAVVCCAAYTAVDAAEDNRDLAAALNTRAPAAMAKWCASHGVPFVHYSTDYVYPGTGERPWREDDTPQPLNHYGATKLAGDLEVARAFAISGISGATHSPEKPSHGGYLVFRTSWIYDAHGKNFFRTMLRLGADREELRVVDDQTGAPTYAPHLAQASLRALAHALDIAHGGRNGGATKGGTFPSGVYHLCGGGETTWHGFAEAIFEHARRNRLPIKVRRVLPIPTEEFPTPARRPSNSRLDTTKAERVLDERLPAWREGLDECFAEFMKTEAAR